jgi:hydroxyacylglutathione hydrolase
MRLTRDIALVGGGDTGFNISAPLDCHIYLIDGGDDLAIVDAGMGGKHGETETILSTIQENGFSVDRISRLILTHYHADHAGGSKDFKDRLGVEVIGSPLTAQTVSAGDEEVISLPFAKAAGFYPQDYVFEACPVMPSLKDGEGFSVGRLKITSYFTPGHSADHMSLLVEGGERTYLIAGDVIFYGGTIIAQNIPDCSIQDYGRSAKKLAELEFDALLPGHFQISLRNGKRHIDRAAEQFSKLMIPRNAV